ncbi:MAG: cation transporter, partial [Dialister sp.]|nr:cation transporter [Dialister sp.]
MAKYKDNKIDVMESDADIAIDERRAFGHFHDKGVHHHDGHKNDCHCHDCIDEEDCDYCGKDLASCQCDFLGKEYKRGLYHMEHLDCMECAAKMEGKIREMPSVFFASVSFTKKELRVISKENPDNLIPQLLSVCRTVDENIGIVPPSDKGDFKTEIYEIPTLDCAACAVKLEKLVNRQPGVLSASISFATKTMKLTAKDPDSLIPELTRKCNEVESPTEIRKKQRPTKAQKKSAAKKEASFLERLKSEKSQLTIGGLLFVIGMLMHYQPAGLFAGLASIGDYFFFVSYLILGGPIVYTALKNITHGEFFDETFLMTVATVGAFAIHEYPEAVGVMLFYRIGEYFQDLAADRSRDQIMDAVDLRPEVVQRVTASGTETIPA